MNIKRQFFADIVAVPRRKQIEYRNDTPYWLERLARVGKAPFNLRLLNGMQHPIPEATIRVLKVVHIKRNGELQFHLGKVLQVKHWYRQKECPKD